jgi:hypothetical protein
LPLPITQIFIVAVPFYGRAGFFNFQRFNGRIGFSDADFYLLWIIFLHISILNKSVETKVIDRHERRSITLVAPSIFQQRERTRLTTKSSQRLGWLLSKDRKLAPAFYATAFSFTAFSLAVRPKYTVEATPVPVPG